MSSNELGYSVIIPFLNTEKFLQETMASVFAQTYENWQLLLVDDGSSDASAEIARQCAKSTREKYTISITMSIKIGACVSHAILA